MKPISFYQAQDLVLKESKEWGFEEVMLENAIGRVLYEDIFADRNYPPFNRSAVDGFAVRSEDLNNNSEFNIIEEVHAGTVSKKILSKNTAIKIMTGAPVPPSADRVIKVEDSKINGNLVSFSYIDIKSSNNIAKEGEDTQKGALVISRNKICNALMLGTLASLGKSKVKVIKLPVIAIISTGNEIKNINEEVLAYQIRDSNSYSLLGFFKQYHISPKYRTIVKDEKHKLKEAIQSVLNADIIILSGGVSMGDADFVPEVLAEVGVKKIFHKAAIKPGKPIWFGIKGKSAVFALPGNPFSVQVAFKIFIEAYLRSCLGIAPLKKLKLPLNGIKKKKTSFDEFFPCRISSSTNTSLEIVSFNGSGDITAALESDGIALHPADQDNILEGKYVEFTSWNCF